VCLLAGSYQSTISGLVDALGPLSKAEEAHVFGETARRAYNLESERYVEPPPPA
jgi:predicted TIM-barrel fold metal-dependent hydrolase